MIHTAVGGQPIAWSYCRTGGGGLISSTDQDFVRLSANPTPAHMRNILLRLAAAPVCDKL